MKFRIKTKRQNRLVEFNGILPDVIKELDIQDSFVIERIRSIWENITGNIISTHSIPDRIFKKTLFVAVDHSVYANELMMMKDTILKRIKNEISANLIINLKTEIKKLKWKTSAQKQQ